MRSQGAGGRHEPDEATQSDAQHNDDARTEFASTENDESRARTSSDKEGVVAHVLNSLRSLSIHLKGRASKSDATGPLLETFDLEGVASYIQKMDVTNIVCMCGAGISVAAGIPDFRTPGSGLYDNLRKFDLPYPEAVFELDYFENRPEPFFQLAKELLPGRYEPTATHRFMKLLHEKGRLLRCYTQNIDSLETAAGLPPNKVVAAHGNFDSASCIKCKRKDSPSRFREAVEAGQVVRCAVCGALVKPDIVFFGEGLPERFFRSLARDFPKAELLIILGTSLVVHPFAGLRDRVPPKCPRLLINREVVGTRSAKEHARGITTGLWFGEGNMRDAKYIGDCDDAVHRLTGLLGWQHDSAPPASQCQASPPPVPPGAADAL